MSDTTIPAAMASAMAGPPQVGPDGPIIIIIWVGIGIALASCTFISIYCWRRHWLQSRQERDMMYPVVGSDGSVCKPPMYTAWIDLEEGGRPRLSKDSLPISASFVEPSYLTSSKTSSLDKRSSVYSTTSTVDSLPPYSPSTTLMSTVIIIMPRSKSAGECGLEMDFGLRATGSSP